MNTIKSKLAGIARILACVMSVTFAADVSADVPEGGYQFFTNMFSVAHDMLNEDLTTGKLMWQSDIASVQSLIDEQGWTTGQVVEVLSYLVTNGIPTDTKRWTGPVRNKLILDKSLSMMPVFCGTNALPAIEHVIDRQNPLVSVSAFSEYATVLGFGHDAFCRYTQKLSEPSSMEFSDRWTAFYRIQEVFEKSSRSNAETNRIVALLMHVANEYNQHAWSAKKFDVHACDLWPMYATSSNRLDYINMHLADDMPSKASNYFANVRAELLALPPGTMQMLPTNQFYNVED